jgi:uracil DNA glycosylase superfamily protein
VTNEQIWIGNCFEVARILVLGESWYGHFEGSLVTDAGYIAEYLAGKQPDKMYTKMANAVGMSREEFWNQIAFTNFVQCVGPDPSARPTVSHYTAAQPRLAELLARIRPRGVWVLGVEQAQYSTPIIESAGIPCEVAWHPTRPGTTNAMLGESWGRLHEKLQHGDGRAVIEHQTAERFAAVNPREREIMSHSGRRLIKRASAILEFLRHRRGEGGLIVPIRNVDLMQQMEGRANCGVVFGQANSLLDLACLVTGMPLLGRLVTFERKDDCVGAWANWKTYMPFISLASRFKVWSDDDFDRIQNELEQRPGVPARMWKDLEPDSERLLCEAAEVARRVLESYAEQFLPTVR